MSETTEKQKRFCDEYLVDLNASAAARRAGYSEKNAGNNVPKILKNTNVRAYIDKRMKEKESELIASQDEVLEYLTSVLRGETNSEVVVTELVGDGCSQAKCIGKAPDEKERLKAAELLGKRYGLYTEKIEEKVDMDLNIQIDYGDQQ